MAMAFRMLAHQAIRASADTRLVREPQARARARHRRMSELSSVSVGYEFYEFYEFYGAMGGVMRGGFTIFL